MLSPRAKTGRFALDDAGRVAGARWIPSPNSDARPGGEALTLVVIHNISLPPGEFGGNGIVELFTNCLDPAAHPYYAAILAMRVSSHFVIRRDGELVQFVSCEERAWHAGVSNWRGRDACNDFSVGIELEGTDQVPYEARQYSTLGSLIPALRVRYPTLTDLAGHCDIAPGRKSDPGPAFDWPRFLRAIAPRRPSRHEA